MQPAFGGRVRNVGIPSCPYPLIRPSLLKTMSRKLKLFDPERAHKFMCRENNILWNPYKPLNPNQADQTTLLRVRETFCLSSRRGLLPWRVATHKTDSCILEPYHPERVAMQFRLDQVIPYPPLTSLVTENAVGITYAHWQ